MANGETFDQIRKIVESGQGLSRKQTDMLVLAALADVHKQVNNLHAKWEKESASIRKLVYIALAAVFVVLFVPELRDMLLKALLTQIGL